MAEEADAVNVPADNTVPENEPLLSVDATGEKPEGQESPESAEDGGDTPLLTVENGEEKKDEGKEPEKEEPEGAPEKYEAFTMPDGWELPTEMAEEVGTVFRELNLSQKAGQKLVDTYIKHAAAVKEQELIALQEQRKAWRAERRQSPAYQSERALAIKGLNAVVKTDEQRDLFNNTWLQDHPAIFGLFVNVGRLLGEDVPLNTGNPAGNEGDSAVARFPVKL